MIRPWCVYRLYDKDGRVLYVGSTCDFDRRLTEHRRKAPFGPEIASWTLNGSPLLTVTAQFSTAEKP